MVTRKDLTPWLANLFVNPKYRHMGVIFPLFKRLEQEVKRLGLTHLYLYTFHHENYYKRLGFKVVEKTNYADHDVTILKIDLDKN